MPVPLPNRLMNLWNHTLADLSLPVHEVKYLEPFTVFGFDLFHAGTVDSKYGAIIGIPINFTYTDVSSVDAPSILVNREAVNWNRQDAKQLLESLILSADAQQYGIAREILMTRNNSPLIKSLIGAFMVSSTYLFCRTMNDKFKLLERPLSVRGFFYFLACLFSIGIWATQIDLYNVYLEKKVDLHLAQSGDHYVKGAIEFYIQMLNKNVALRSLLGPQGESIYTPKGNEKFFFRQPRIPLEKRKEFFENVLVKLKHERVLSEKDEIVSHNA